MYFGTTAFKTVPNAVNESYGIESVVYTEYLNKKSILESCTDEAQRPLLEAQLQVLQEVAIRDLFTKVKEAFNKLKNWIKNLWDSIFNKAKKRRQELEEYANKDLNKFKKDLHDGFDKAFGNDEVTQKFKEYVENFVSTCKSFSYRCNDKEYRIGGIENLANNPVHNVKLCHISLIQLDIDSLDEPKELEKLTQEVKEFTDSVNSIEIAESPMKIYTLSLGHIKENACSELMKNYAEMQKGVNKDYDKLLSYRKEIFNELSEIEKEIDEKQKHVDDYIEKVGEDGYGVEKFRGFVKLMNDAMREIKNLNEGLLKLSEKVNSVAAKITVECNKVEAFMAKDFEYDRDKAAEEKKQREKEENEKKEED